MDSLQIGTYTFHSRLFVGTGKYGNLDLMRESLLSSESELITLALKRIDYDDSEDELLKAITAAHVRLLPNTSGARTANEAILAAQLAREALETDLIKLEIHPDPRYLLPDPIETLKATEELAKQGFVVLPYIHADPVLCKRLEEAGTSAVMPLGSPIGSNKGLKTIDFLEIIIQQSKVPVVIDAGIGAPSDACKAMELGADAVLVNTAIATAKDPVHIASAFKWAVKAGRSAYLSGIPAKSSHAHASSPLTSFLMDL